MHSGTIRVHSAEKKVLESIKRAFAQPGARMPAGLVTGIGHDAAIVQGGPGRLLAISSDAFLAGVHFLPGIHVPADVGYKALARSVSDLAAVGAAPKYFLMNLALPDSLSPVWLNRFAKGMAQAARRFQIHLIGGDLTRPASSSGLAANLTVFGEFRGYQPVLRNGAKPGDTIFLSGTAGAAQIGFELLRRNPRRKSPWRSLLQRHLRPEPRLALGAWLARQGLATAMIDTSDGLSSDLRNLCFASRVGAIVESEKIPVVKLPQSLPHAGLNLKNAALHGGDDYELLFTVSVKNLAKIPRRWKGVPLTPIGRITRGGAVLLAEGDKKRQLTPMGWDPFESRITIGRAELSK